MNTNTHSPNPHLSLHRDPIDEMLKADAAEHRDVYIDDGGFTLRVIDALPPRAQGVSPAVRFGIPFGLAALAAIVVTFLTDGGGFFIDAAMDLGTSTLTASSFGFLVMVGAMFVLAATVARDR